MVAFLLTCRNAGYPRTNLLFVASRETISLISAPADRFVKQEFMDALKFSARNCLVHQSISPMSIVVQFIVRPSIACNGRMLFHRPVGAGGISIAVTIRSCDPSHRGMVLFRIGEGIPLPQMVFSPASGTLSYRGCSSYGRSDPNKCQPLFSLFRIKLGACLNNR